MTTVHPRGVEKQPCFLRSFPFFFLLLWNELLVVFASPCCSRSPLDQRVVDQPGLVRSYKDSLKQVGSDVTAGSCNKGLFC